MKKINISLLSDINQKVMLQWENLFKTLNIKDYQIHNHYITMQCPIHGGDNDTALNLYLDGSNSFPGYWKCNTNNCHDVFGKNIIGFTRGMLSKKKYNWTPFSNKVFSLQDTIDYLLEFLKINHISLIESDHDNNINNQNFTNQINNIFTFNNHFIGNNITRKQIRQKLKIPAEYYLQRGYSDTILSKYDVGLCTNGNKKMYNRVVVPVYDEHNRYIGCTGRSINGKKPKWLHSKNFRSGQYLYNYCNAKKYIKQSNVAIITESPGNVWRLEENGIHNAVALFGTSISMEQFKLLSKSGALSLIVLLDNDEAGHKGMRKIQQQYQRIYRLYFPNISQNDIGEMSKDEITSEIKTYINNIYS